MGEGRVGFEDGAEGDGFTLTAGTQLSFFYDNKEDPVISVSIAKMDPNEANVRFRLYLV
jgi:hypothetical protein